MLYSFYFLFRQFFLQREVGLLCFDLWRQPVKGRSSRAAHLFCIIFKRKDRCFSSSFSLSFLFVLRCEVGGCLCGLTSGEDTRF